jgi:hypothetical protein
MHSMSYARSGQDRIDGGQCSAAAMESLMAEAISYYSKQGPAGAVALEAVGFRIGRQLVERYETLPDLT